MKKVAQYIRKSSDTLKDALNKDPEIKNIIIEAIRRRDKVLAFIKDKKWKIIQNDQKIEYDHNQKPKGVEIYIRVSQPFDAGISHADATELKHLGAFDAKANGDIFISLNH